MNAAAKVMIVIFLLMLTMPVQALTLNRREHSMTWSRDYGPYIVGGGGNAVAETLEGGFVLTGVGAGGLVLKLNPVGKPQWERNYLPEGYVRAEGDSIEQTNDGGYIVSGQALSSHFGYDAWLLRLDREGYAEWSRTFGGTDNDVFHTARLAHDGGFIIAGNSASIGSGHSFNGWILKVDPEGRVSWQRFFVGQDISSVVPTRDGGFVAVGTVGVADRAEAWVVKLDSEGGTAWQKAYEVATRTDAYWVEQTSDGGYVLAGDSSFGALVLRLDGTGTVLWADSLGGGFGITAHSVQEMHDRGFIVTGRSLGPQTGPWLARLDAEGNLLWGRYYGGGFDFLFDAFEVSYGTARAGERPLRGIVAAGTQLCCGLWLLKLDDNGNVEGCEFPVSPGAWTQSDIIGVEETAQFSLHAGLAGHTTSVLLNTVETTVQEQCPVLPATDT